MVTVRVVAASVLMVALCLNAMATVQGRSNPADGVAETSHLLSGRQSVFFGFGWRFQLQKPADVRRGETCLFQTDVSNRSCVGMSLHEDTNHWTPEDCELSCCSDPSCLVWQYESKGMYLGPGNANWNQGRCLHGGGDVSCDINGSTRCLFDVSTSTPCIGGQRYAFQPLRRDWPFIQPAYDDTKWPAVDVPHDFVINGSFAPDNDAHRAFLPRGVGIYRKNFTLPTAWQGSTVQLVFDAALQYTEVYLNGQHVADHRGGYTRFVVRLDNVSSTRYGMDNVLAVRTDARWGSGHWYEGGGIIRAIHLERLPPIHFVTDGVFVSPEVGADGNIFMSAELQMLQHSDTSPVVDTDIFVSFTLRTLEGAVIDHNSSAKVTVSPGVTAIVFSTLSAAATTPWSTFAFSENKTLHSPKATYLMTVSIKPDAGIDPAQLAIDEINVTCGFRRTEWHNKFWLNGAKTQLRGFSHHDNFAGVGVAMPARIFLFHAQPYDDVVYSMLDALGVMVWDEARDFYVSRVNEFRSLVKHHRSHPSIVVWGFCNEQECYPKLNANPDGPNATVVAFKSEVEIHDGMRPVTMNDNGLQDGTDLDIAGWSHSSADALTQLHRQKPNMPQLLSECCSCPSTRTSLPGISCMQGQNAPGLLPFVAGSIGVWTMNDYYGEQAKWPSTVAGYGQIDLAGFPKRAASWYRENWLRHPNASYATSASAEELHAKLARDSKTYEAGRLQNLTLSVDVPSSLTCTGDKVVLDGRDVALLRIAVVDANGVPTSAGAPEGGVNVSVEVVSGPGRLVGVGNGDLSTHQRPQGNVIQVDQLARAVIQVTIDCVSENRELSRTIDTQNENGQTQVLKMCPSPLPEIVVEITPITETSPTLTPARVTIHLSDDVDDGPLAVARRSEPCAFDYIDSFDGRLQNRFRDGLDFSTGL